MQPHLPLLVLGMTQGVKDALIPRDLIQRPWNSALDALCDAETAWPWLEGDINAWGVVDGMLRRLEWGWPLADVLASAAASQAFLAVPGLRGDA